MLLMVEKEEEEEEEEEGGTTPLPPFRQNIEYSAGDAGYT
jgi:hypothetical protein